MRRAQQEEEAEREARRVANFETRQEQLRLEPNDDEGFLQILASRVSDQAQVRATREGGVVGRNVANTGTSATYDEAAELDAMPTSPSTHRSPTAETGLEAILEADGLRSDMQNWHSQLDMQTRQREQLEQELKDAKEQLKQYAAERNAVEVLRGAAVMDDNDDEVARLKLRAERMRGLWNQSREDVARLEDELARKDEAIVALRMQISTQTQDAQRQDTSNEIGGGGGQATSGRSRRRSSARLLSRDATGTKVITPEAVHRLSRAHTFLLN